MINDTSFCSYFMQTQYIIFIILYIILYMVKRDKSIKTKFYAIMLLHALGDTIGFKNGDWEFNYHDIEKLENLDYVNEMIYEFIDLGGVNGINLQGWKVSDDTILHIASARSLLSYNDKIDEKFINKIKKNIKKEYSKMIDEKKEINRYVGKTTSYSIERFTKKHDARKDPYDELAGGNGAAMRTLVFGMCFFGQNNRDLLINSSVISSQLTHNNPIGYLGGFTAAFFVALALEGRDINDWPYILLIYLKTSTILQQHIISLTNIDETVYYGQYIKYWTKYIDTKFDKNKKPLKIRSNSNPLHRIKYYYDNFYIDSISKKNKSQIGSSGYLCMIMAYDALLDCDGIWEKLIVYSILHNGDSDTIGAVAGGLYGALYGFGDVPKKMLKYIERKDELKKVSSKLYKKFVKN